MDAGFWTVLGQVKARSGIYEIANRSNGKRYIGSAICLYHRCHTHFSRLRKGIHHNAHLQNAWCKYGANVFGFKVLLFCLPVHLLDYEQRCLNNLKPEYNTQPTAGSCLGTKQSPETKSKRSLTLLGNKNAKGTIWSDEMRTKHSSILKNRKYRHCQEAIEKMAAAKIGNKYGLGHKCSQEKKPKYQQQI